MCLTAYLQVNLILKVKRLSDMAIWRRLTLCSKNDDVEPLVLYIPFGVFKRFEENGFDITEKHILTRSQMDKVKRHFSGQIENITFKY